jgi:hypothetical protein
LSANQKAPNQIYLYLELFIFIFIIFQAISLDHLGSTITIMTITNVAHHLECAFLSHKHLEREVST